MEIKVKYKRAYTTLVDKGYHFIFDSNSKGKLSQLTL